MSRTLLGSAGRFHPLGLRGPLLGLFAALADDESKAPKPATATEVGYRLPFFDFFFGAGRPTFALIPPAPDATVTCRAPAIFPFGLAGAGVPENLRGPLRAGFP